MRVRNGGLGSTTISCVAVAKPGLVISVRMLSTCVRSLSHPDESGPISSKPIPA